MKLNGSNGLALIAIVLWGCTAAVPVVRAEGGRQDEAKQADQLSDDGLKQMLTGMGYEPKPLSKGFLVAVKQATWTLNMQAVISPDKRKLGLNANMGSVEDPSKITADVWLALLVSNGDIDPSSFYFDKKSNKLYLHRSFDNRSLTPASLKKELDNFGGQITQTADLWKFTK